MNYTGISFLEFVNQIEVLISSKNIINPHWDTQLPRNVNYTIPADFIVRQESLNSDLDKLSDFLGKHRFTPEHKNKTVYTNKIKEEENSDLSTLSSINLISRNIKLESSNLVRGDIESKLKKIYNVDFEFFGY